MKNHTTLRVQPWLAGGICLWLTMTVPLAAQSPTTAARTHVATNLAMYATGVRLLLEQTRAQGTNLPPVMAYLTTCSEQAQNALARIPQSEDPAAVVEQFEQQRDQRNFALEDQIRSADPKAPPLNGYPAVRSEIDLHERCLAKPFLNSLWKHDTHVRVELFRRKYLDPEDGQANIIEAWAQDCPLTRFNEERKVWYRKAGVSAWEVKLRLEPVIMLNSGKDPAVLFSGGLLYNFFPGFDDKGTVDETFYSKNVKRTGLCLGGGARFHDGGQTLLISGGWQVRYVTFWGLYDTADHQYSWGLGVSEWDWLKKVLPAGLLNALAK